MLEMNLSKKDLFVLSLQLVLGITTLGFGIWFLRNPNILRSFGYLSVIGITVGFFIVFTIRSIINKSPFDVYIMLGSLVLSTVFIVQKNIFYEIVALCFALWSFINAFIRSFEIYLMFLDKKKGKFFKACYVLFEIVMGVLLLMNPWFSKTVVNIQISIYVIVNGIIQIISALNIIYKRKQASRLMAPVLLAALMPNYQVNRANRLAQRSKVAFIPQVTPTENQHVSVYIYGKNSGHSRVGHIDIGYKGTIYSYGAHDPYHRAKSMMYGAGVLIVGNEKAFVEEAIGAGFSVFCFTIQLSDFQSTLLESSIENLMAPAYVYDYPSDIDPEGKNYLTRLDHLNAGLKFYKFYDGPLKIYNVFKTNCVLVADALLESTGMKLYQMSGIVTPGAYYEYLMGLLKKPGSMVVDYKIYKNDQLT